MNKKITDKAVSSRLKGLYADDKDAKAIFDYLASCKKAMNVSYVHRLVYKVEIEYGDVVRVLKELAQIGCGRFIPGRHGKKSRIAWNSSLVSVGQVAKGEAEEVQQLENYVLDDDEFEDADERDTNAPQGENESDLIAHVFQLRPELPIRINLPDDFTEREAERLSAFIKTLPFF